MKSSNEIPKSVKKTIRYINQAAPLKDLNEIQKLVNEAIEKRKKSSYR